MANRLYLIAAAAAMFPGFAAHAEVIGVDSHHRSEIAQAPPEPEWLLQSREIAELVRADGLVTTAESEAHEERAALAASGEARLEKLNWLIASYMSLGYADKASRLLAIYDFRAEKDGSRRHRAASGVLHAYRHSLVGDYKLAADEIDELLAAEEDPYVVATGSTLAAYAWTDSGYPSKAYDQIRKGRRAALKLANPNAVLSGIHDAWAYVSLDTGDYKSAIEQTRLSLHYAQAGGAPVDGISILYNLALIASDQGKHAAARDFALTEAGLARKTGIPEEAFYASFLCAAIEEAAKNYVAAESCARDAVVNPAAVEDFIVSAKGRLATALAKLGRAGEARAILDELKVSVDPETAPRDAVSLKKLEAQVLFAEGAFAPAMAAFEEHQIASDKLQKENFNDGVKEIRAGLESDLDDALLRAMATEKEAALMKERVHSQQSLILLAFTLFLAAIVTLLGHRRFAAKLSVAKNAAEAANRAKTEFLASMSHELRTPLNGVLGMAQSLAGENLAPMQLAKVETILDSGKSLLALLNDVLDLSKVEAGKMEISPIDEDLEQTMLNIVNLFQPLAAEKGNRIALEYFDSAPKWVNFDPVRVRQCVINLVSNAVKFTEHGEIIVSVDARAVENGFEFSVSVSDTGIGMSKEAQSRIFSPYTQGDASISQKFGGTGLGLAIARRVARLMGGDIAVASAPGEGTTMTLTFFAAASSSDEREGNAGVHGVSAGQKHASSRDISAVLIVDDVLINRQVAALFIKPLEATILEAASGGEALKILSTHDVDLILLDIQMPGIDGFETARQIRLLKSQNAEATIVALTAATMDGEYERCFEAGMDGFAVKPLDSRGLMSVIAAATAQRRAKRAEKAA